MRTQLPSVSWHRVAPVWTGVVDHVLRSRLHLRRQPWPKATSTSSSEIRSFDACAALPPPPTWLQASENRETVSSWIQLGIETVGRTTIEWADWTFNPWVGCAKVSEACRNCYAEVRDIRFNRGRNWGPTASRTRTTPGNWRKPLRWNAQLQGTGRRERVFCASLADVFEAHEALPPWREDLWSLVEQTPHLIWMLLTKRPENIRQAVPQGWLEEGAWPDNVWLGTTAEDQVAADERIQHLPAAPVRFLSCEPLLGPLDLQQPIEESRVDWVITGGESGPGARPSHPDWFRSLRDQCTSAGVAFHFKQWGMHDASMARVGKRAAGRELDGRTWDEVPNV